MARRKVKTSGNEWWRKAGFATEHAGRTARVRDLTGGKVKNLYQFNKLKKGAAYQRAADVYVSVTAPLDDTPKKRRARRRATNTPGSQFSDQVISRGAVSVLNDVLRPLGVDLPEDIEIDEGDEFYWDDYLEEDWRDNVVNWEAARNMFDIYGTPKIGE